MPQPVLVNLRQSSILGRMRQVNIQEFSLSTSVEYRRPVAFSEAKLESVARVLAAPPCGEFLNPAEISLTKQNELFSYSLTVPMLNGAASIVINAQGVTVSFKQGKTRDHLELMIKLTLASLEATRTEEVKRSIFSFTTHALFDSPLQYTEHMKRFTELAPNVVSGGLIMVTQFPEISGELRYASEKSLAYPDALFIASSSVCQTDVTANLFKILEEKFEAVAALEGVGFKKN